MEDGIKSHEGQKQQYSSANKKIRGAQLGKPDTHRCV